MKLNYQLIIYTRINSKWIKDLNISCDTIKILEENIGSKISDISSTNIFEDISPRARKIKEKLNKQNYIKLKSFHVVKESTTKMKRELTSWENIFANDISDKSLISKIHEELIQFNPRKTNNPIKKWLKGQPRHLFKEDIQIVHRHMKTNVQHHQPSERYKLKPQ